jgi:hypothetical protein
MSKVMDWFVNRSKQYEGFLRMVARETHKQIMLVEAPAEMGKTWLIQRLYHECMVRRLPVAHFDFHDRRAWDYLALVRQARDQMGAEYFNSLTEVINDSTRINVALSAGSGADSVDVSIANQGGRVRNSQVQVGDVAGGSIVKDNFFFIQAESPDIRRSIEVRITDAFINCLKALSQHQVVVFLLDSYEEATVPAAHWLMECLFSYVRSGLLPNIIVVIAGVAVPQFDDTWNDCVARTGLALFKSEHIAEYIQRRGLVGLDIDTVVKTCGGNPGLLAKMADVVAASAERDEEDWLQ